MLQVFFKHIAIREFPLLFFPRDDFFNFYRNKLRVNRITKTKALADTRPFEMVDDALLPKHDHRLMFQLLTNISQVVYLFRNASLRIKNHNFGRMLSNLINGFQNPVEDQTSKTLSVQDFFQNLTPELIG